MSVDWLGNKELSKAFLAFVSALEKEDASLVSITYSCPKEPRKAGSYLGVELWEKS